jgi:hypothetical protein
MIGGFNENLIIAEDQEIAWRAGKKGKMIFLKSAAAYSSMRREEKLGYIKTALLWIINYIGVLFFKKSSKVWHPVR